MAKYKAYPEYKTISNSWLDSIPKGWELLPLKYLCTSFVKDGPHETPVFLEEGVPFLSVDGIQNNKLVFEGCRYISPSDHYRFSQKCKPVKGDVLLGKAASIGKVALVDTSIEFNVWSPLAVITPIRSCLSKFIYYSFQTTMLQAQCEVYSNSNTQKNLGMNTIDNLDFAMPSDKEASTISNFLDHEIAKIDNLIEKQNQLIDLLKEKRQAVISHAVTKGLNPDVSMKDSGVEWLGDVPEHWNVTKLKYACASIIAGPFGSSITKDMYVNDGYKVYGQEQVIPNDFNIGDYFISPKDFYKLSRYEIKVGDILISCVGTFGKIAVFPDWARPGIINPRLIKATLVPKMNPSFIREFLKSKVVSKQFELLSRGGTMGVINIAILNEIMISIPPIEEQNSINEFIYSQKKKFFELIDKANSQINFLQERRTALISAAVTGKMDVRDWVAPDTQDLEEPQEATA